MINFRPGLIRPAKVMANAFRAGFVRREALLFEWRWETCTCGLSQQPVEAGGGLSREVSVWVGAAPTKPGCVSDARWRGAASMDREEYVRN